MTANHQIKTFYRAVETRNYALVEELLAKGKVDPNSCRVDSKRGRSTTLETAIANNDTRMVKLLLEWGLDPNVEDEEGETPLFSGCSYRL